MARIDSGRLLRPGRSVHPDAMQERPVSLRDTFGLWSRSLIAWPDGRRDTTTFVAWLQGPAMFADLRQPAGGPSFADVLCLNHLQPHHMRWLAGQEGFAGRLIHAGRAFEWHRVIDYQCPTAAVDAGYLRFSKGVLIEQGRDLPYVEHWHRESPAGFPHFAIKALDQHGRLGFLVRAGGAFMYVRDRHVPLPKDAVLKDLVEAATLEQARAMVDCEISLGLVRGPSWRIERSSLPFRVGADLAVSFDDHGRNFTTTDVTADGEGHRRHWKVVDLEVEGREQDADGAGRAEEKKPRRNR